MEQGQLNKKYWKLTGLTYAIEDIIEDAANKTEEEKANLANALAWNVKAGAVITGGATKELYKEVIAEIASSLGVDESKLSRLVEDEDDGSNDEEEDDSTKGEVTVNP
jgi:acyl-CoA synthetase (NDP forming)